MAPTDTNDERPGTTLVAVMHKPDVGDKDVSPGLVSLEWLRRFGEADGWVEVDPETRKAVTQSSASGSVADILGRVENGEIAAADALAAEQAKGDKARSSLVEKLTALVAAGEEG